MHKLLHELKEGFGLKSKHITLLEALIGDKATADQLAKITQIPLGRIYGHLNALLSLGLINRSPKRPYMYSIDDVRENVTDFLKGRIDQISLKQERILDILAEKNPVEEVEFVSNGDDFAFKLIQFVAEAPSLKVVVRHDSLPFTCYPDNSKSFEQLRKVIVDHRSTLAHTTHESTILIYKAFRDALKERKPIITIMEHHSLVSNLAIMRKYMGKSFVQQWFKEMDIHARNPLRPVYVVSEYVPMQIFISPKKVFMSIIHLGVTTGVIIRSKKVVKLYEEFFDDMLERSKSLKNYLDHDNTKINQQP